MELMIEIGQELRKVQFLVCTLTFFKYYIHSEEFSIPIKSLTVLSTLFEFDDIHFDCFEVVNWKAGAPGLPKNRTIY